MCCQQAYLCIIEDSSDVQESDAPNTQHAQAACEHNSRVSAVSWAMPIQDEWTPNDAAEPLHLPDLAWMCSSPMSSPTFMFQDDGAADSAAMPFQPLEGQLLSGSLEDHSEGNPTSKRQKRSAAACDRTSTCITTAAAPVDSPMLVSQSRSIGPVQHGRPTVFKYDCT